MPAGSTRTAKWLHRRWVQIALVAIVAAVMLAAAPTLVQLPDYPARRAAALRDSETLSRAGLSADARLALEKDLLLYETDSRIKIWTAIVQAIGGAALFVGLLFTWRNLRATHHKLDIDREQQLTSRFTAATSQLGAQLGDGRPNIEARLGGIYALASIARDSPRDYWPVMEIFTSYVRHNAAWHHLGHAQSSSSSGPASETKPRTDIQAILTVLGRSTPPEGAPSRLDQKLDLRHTDLRGAEFWDAHLNRADFWGAHLEGAKLWGACLNEAKLVKAHLREANLRAVTFVGADLTEADLTGADLAGADLRGAIGLTRAQVASAKDSGDGALLPQALPEAGIESAPHERSL